MSTLKPVATEGFANQPSKEAFASHNNPLSDGAVKHFDPVLKELQANVLKPHGRNYANHCMFCFKLGSEMEVKNWLIRFSARLISAKGAVENKQDGATFFSFLLSAKGYQYLGIDPPQVSKAFVKGMKEARKELNLDPSKWEKCYRLDIHAMCVIADDNKECLDAETNALWAEVGEMTTESWVERGLWKWRPGLQDSDREEHFGYRDGRSNPIFFESELERQGKLDPVNWNSGAGPSLVCVPDPHGGKFGCGSYFVFQKLEQHVKGFFDAKKTLAEVLGIDTPLAGAFMVGRFENGTPLILTGKSDPNSPEVAPNDFDYALMDARGLKCPVFSHIRKVNYPAASGGAFKT